jgi:protein-tyrosine kinase
VSGDRGQNGGGPSTDAGAAHGEGRHASAGSRDVDGPRDGASSQIVLPKGPLAEYDSAPWAERGAVFGVPADAPLPAGMATAEQIESFRELRTRLMLMAASNGLTHFTTIVVPLTEDSGGSFVARNLAAAFTLQRRHALLVDCNFRNATQHRALGTDPEIEGLFEFLGRAGQAPSSLPMWPTVIPGLHVIPAGRCQPAFTAAHVDYLASNAMKQLMTTLRAWPCFIVLDAPPVKSSPDARLLSDLADLVVLVVASGRSTTQDIAKAVAVFDRKKFAGVAFNEYAGGARRAG